jgi:hypothetical protein
MRIIGCDLHARQQTLAMLDTATGEVVKTTLKHTKVIACGSFIPALYGRCEWESKRRDPCSGL